jgi:hypothetical protein
MKKILTLIAIVFVAAILLPSCKKDWTCVCTDSSGAETSYPIGNSRKPDAQLICNAYGLTDECKLK